MKFLNQTPATRLLKYTTILCGVVTMSLVLSSCSDTAETQKAEAPVEKVEAQAKAEPALWLVKDADTNVYLFGTVHVLKPETKWQNAKFDKAFAQSDAIYQEADVGASVQQNLSALIPALGMYSDGGGLFEDLDDAEEKEVLEAAEIVGLPPEALARMKPWFAAIGLTQMQMIKSGYRPDSGVEAIITKKANAAGKNIRYFETAEQQLRLLAGMPEDSQIEFLVAGAEAIEDNPTLLDDLVADWAEGDVAGIGALMSDEDVLGNRTIYDIMLVNRNRNWVTEIKTLMDDEAGTFFIAVGAAHLAGEDSVIAMLRNEGERVVRQ